MSVFHIQPNMVFPSTKMEAVNKLITEGNLTRLINTLIDSDKYIIPPEGTDFINTKDVVLNLGGNAERYTLINLPINYASSHLEFSIHGYYFDLGPIGGETGVISAIQRQSPSSNIYKLSAQIFIDTTVPNYPELFGQTDIAQTMQKSGSIVLGTTTLAEDCRKLAITQITARGSDNVVYDLSYNTNWVLNSAQEIPSDITFTNGYTVHYNEYSNIINLYILDLDESYPVPNIGDGISFEVYNLDLLYCINNEYYFPLSSFVKFNYQSIGHIDGGVLTSETD